MAIDLKGEVYLPNSVTEQNGSKQPDVKPVEGAKNVWRPWKSEYGSTLMSIRLDRHVYLVRDSENRRTKLASHRQARRLDRQARAALSSLERTGRIS